MTNKHKIKISVGKAPPRKQPDTTLNYLIARMKRIADAVLLRPRAVALLSLAGFILFIGTPHVGWDYQCRNITRGYGGCASASWCAYYGIQGRRIEFPRDGARCKLVTFLPIDWGKVFNEVLG